MAVKENKSLVEEKVSYQVEDGQDVELTESIVRSLTNDNPNITSGEIKLFINLCKYQKLNPFTKECFLVKYKDKPAQIVTSLGAFMRIADERPTYEGMEDGIIVKTNDKKIVDREGCVLYDGETLIGGWAKVYRSDRKFPAVSRLNLKEYSKGQSTWNAMPCTMINKCAKVSALRKAFPQSFQGLYSEDEIKNAGSVESVEDDIVYKVDDTQNGEVVVEDKEVLQIPENAKTPDIYAPLTETNGDGIKVVPYAEYYNHKEDYDKVDYPDGSNAYQVINGKKTIRVKVKE